MPQEKLLKTLRTMQSDINVMTVCGIALNRQVAALIELFTTDEQVEAEDFVLRYHNFATALSTFADSLDAFESHAEDLGGANDE